MELGQKPVCSELKLNDGDSYHALVASKMLRLHQIENKLTVHYLKNRLL